MVKASRQSPRATIRAISYLCVLPLRQIPFAETQQKQSVITASALQVVIMGQAISGILKTTDAVAKDVADSAEAAAQDSLNVMLDLAKAKQSNFLAGLNTVQLHMCPIQTFLVSSQEIR